MSRIASHKSQVSTHKVSIQPSDKLSQYNLPGLKNRSSYSVIRKETSIDELATSYTLKIELTKAKCCVFCKTQCSTLKQCAECIGIGYCSRECQLNDWPHHKTECTEINFVDMFLHSDLVQSISCSDSFFTNVCVEEVHPTPSRHTDILALDDTSLGALRLRQLYKKTLQQGCKLVYLLQNYYQDGYNPCLKKDSSYVCPTGQHHIRGMYPGEIFGVILYQLADQKKGDTPHMCYVDYDSISSFLTYYRLEVTALKDLLTQSEAKLDTYKTQYAVALIDKEVESRWNRIELTLHRLRAVVKKSARFVLQCMQRDLHGVHTYKVMKSKSWKRATHSEDYKIPVSITIQETPQEIIRQLKLDPAHLPYHILIRSQTPAITVDKLPDFNSEFLKYVEEMTSSIAKG